MTSLLEDLRAQITDKQRSALTTIWKHYCEHGQWIDTRLLHHNEGGKSAVRPVLEQLGGSLIFEQEDATTTRYQLTFLGTLLTEEAEQYEQLLAQYLGYLVGLSQRDPLRDYVGGQEVATEMNLNSERTIVLGNLIFLSNLFSRGMGGYGTPEWNASIPANIEDLPPDLLAYIRAAAVERYDPDVPLGTMPRSDYYRRQQLLVWQAQGQNTVQSSERAVEDVQRIVEIKRRRLQIRKEQQAVYGISADPSITIEIEQLEAEIKGLTDRLPSI